MKIGSVGAQLQSLLVLLLGIGHLAQNKIIFRQRLIRARRVGIGREQRVDRLLREQAAGTTEVIEKMGSVGALLQRGLQIWNALHQLSRLELRDSQRGLLVNTIQMRNRFHWISLRQQRIAQKLMRRSKGRVEFQSSLQGRKSGGVVVLLHQSMPQADEAPGKRGFQLRDFSIFAGGNVQMPLRLRAARGIPMLASFWRNSLQG